MEKAVERAGSPSFLEEGGFFGMDNTGNEYVVHAKPGEEADPSLNEDAAINLFQAADPSSIPGGSIVGTFHTHPDGTKTIGNTTHFFLNEPSGSKEYGDITNARTNSIGVLRNHYVLAQGNKTVYIYNGTGTLGTLPFRSFLSIGLNEDDEAFNKKNRELFASIIILFPSNPLLSNQIQGLAMEESTVGGLP